MSTWWFFGGLVPVAIGFVAFQSWLFPRRSLSNYSCFMTKTADGMPIQFLVKPTRKIGRPLSTSLR